MSQQSRKDPRAKVLSMTVRYKSATLDEFIEHHSYDVSRGGMFIKTQQPFPPGTLLKFEVRIAEDQKVMQGVGRVVWKRDGVSSDPERPSGMGIKYIKLDDESRRLIDQLLASRREEASAFDAGGSADVEEEASVGLGASASVAPRAGNVDPVASFFPKMEPAELPPPEDRTVMKQASELLEEALREVGADSTDGGADGRKSVVATGKTPSLAPAVDESEETKPGRLPTPKAPAVTVSKEPAKSAEQVANELVASAKAAASSSDRAQRALSVNPKAAHLPEPLPTRPDSPKPLSDERLTSSATASKSVSTVAATASSTAAKPSSERRLFWLIAVAASVGAIYWLTRADPAAPPAPVAPVVEASSKPAETSEHAVEPAVQPSIAPSESPSAAAVVASAAGTPTPAPSATAAVAAPTPAMAPVAATKKVVPKAAVKSEPTPTATPNEVDQPAETKPAETKPAETKPAEAQAAAPAEAPPSVPTPQKPAAPPSDNPY